MKELVAAQRQYAHTLETRSVIFRAAMLERLEEFVTRWEPRLTRALEADLGKGAFEAYATEIGYVRSEIRYLRRHLAVWAAPRRVAGSLLTLPGRTQVRPEPYGVALILAPWNYPVQLTLGPLAAALAAGSCAVVKPSEYAPETAKTLEKLLSAAFPPHYVTVVRGGQEVSEALLAERFDCIFFTGSAGVGRQVMAAAAKNLTPVTLELGGKSPCIIADDADLRLAARRIAWGKFLNAGQTCVAPDHVWVTPRRQEELVHYLRQAIERFYGRYPLQNPQLPRIVNQRHYDRLCSLLEPSKVIIGGASLDEALRIEPTVMAGVTESDRVMGEEIFGPILPILNYDDLEALTAHLRRGPSPLALYLFARDRRAQRMVMEGLSFGGGCVNDTVLHLASHGAPFGGVGESGMGACHGKAGFDAFSHYKTVLTRGGLDLPLRYPPYKNAALGLLKKLM